MLQWGLEPMVERLVSSIIAVKKRGHRMRKLILYTAISVDGYLADPQGGLDWIKGDGSEEGAMPWYEEFYHGVDTILMGRKTYRQITQEISPDVWLYGDKETYVFTNAEQGYMPKVHFTSRRPEELIRWLRHRKGGDIWLCGGATLIQPFVEMDLVDEYHLTTIPTLLGQGIHLFSQGGNQQRLRLVQTDTFNGMVDVVYRRER